MHKWFLNSEGIGIYIFSIAYILSLSWQIDIVVPSGNKLLFRGLTTWEARVSRLHNGPCATRRTGDTSASQFLAHPCSYMRVTSIQRLYNLLSIAGTACWCACSTCAKSTWEASPKSSAWMSSRWLSGQRYHVSCLIKRCRYGISFFWCMVTVTRLILNVCNGCWLVVYI